MTPTEREPEQKHYREEISQACRVDLLDSGVCAEQWEAEKSRFLYSLPFFETEQYQ